ncbi:beta-hexosaminidase subunit beta-like [Phymastichus coffea]|uniref:beta-hexosaminidase subunit beta-like n=1 Tax=Phymastichus coffea TaxID=108790 RepID=UPI00273BC19E|nr:beta-hexosaminidase subunit beta-like [Phymastichus coffea]
MRSATDGARLLLLLLLLLLPLLLAGTSRAEWHDDVGPWVTASKGEPWPLPRERQLDEQRYRLLQPSAFQFQVMQRSSCDVLEAAVGRYKRVVAREAELALRYRREERANASAAPDHDGDLARLQIYLSGDCEAYPQLASNESYELRVAEGAATLRANSVWGVLRGLETFSQLAAWTDAGELVARAQRIRDAPLLAHRGLLLDTARHFLPLDDLLLTLEAMAHNKLNVLHWHIVDDNSFPYESAEYPELARAGAYHRSLTYSAADVARVVEEARLRGIRVLPEFDSPGHTRSWGQARPELLTACYGPDGRPSGKLGPMNPARPQLYELMRGLLREVRGRFPEAYLHLGGDEVPFDCWRSNPEVLDFMRRANMSGRFERLEELHVRRLLDIAAELGAKAVVWQEVFDNGVRLAPGTAVQVWTGAWQAEMAAVTRAGHPALLSACWYLDHVAGGGDWLKFYGCDPLDFPAIEPGQKGLVLGGEACMWGEFADKNNVHSRIWPRASAAAERLWSVGRQDNESAAHRLEEHACRMNRRGVPAQPPNGSGFCLS